MKTDFLIHGCLAVLVAALLTGCASTPTGPTNSSTRATPLTPQSGTLPDLTKFEVITVEPFDVTKAGQAGEYVGESFATGIADRLKTDFGPLFSQVNCGKPTGTNNEVIVTGEITSYTPGSRFLRGMLIGLGAASFKGNVCLKEGNTELTRISFSKLWAWGGAVGQSRGIEEMEAEVSASIANTVARQKGWKPK
jgi:hypothetical protein